VKELVMRLLRWICAWALIGDTSRRTHDWHDADA